LKGILLIIGVCLLSGCVLAPAIDSFTKIGVTRSDRQNLFPQEVKRFHDALYWRKYNEALAFVTNEAREDIYGEIRNRSRNERVIDSEITFVDFSEDAYEAETEIAIRYHETTYNLVQTRTEKQIWRFQVSDGWKLVSRKTI